MFFLSRGGPLGGRGARGKCPLCPPLNPALPLPKYLNYFSQCQANHHRSNPNITPEIMYRHFLHPHHTLGEPFFHTGYFSIQIETFFWVALASCLPQNKSQDCYYHFQISPVPAAILSRRSYSTVCANTIIAIFFFVTMCVPNRKTGMAKSKSFSSVASSVWNKLPGHLSSISTLPAFRKRLKHHLFWVPFPMIPHHPLASRFVMSAHPQMWLRSDTPHRLANTFQLSVYD